MNKLSVMLSLITLLGIATSEVTASSVGGGIYVPVQQYQPASACPTGQCQHGNTCGHCSRLGFACVDGATPPPCAASGTCRPKTDTYGYYEQKWRTWPGEESDSDPQPTLADEEVIDPPAPEKEDLQAPPAIEESVEAAIEASRPDVEPLDIQLPPLPRPEQDQGQPAPTERPIPRPGPIDPPRPGREAPPVLPFGWKAPASDSDWQAKRSADEIVTWVEEGKALEPDQTANSAVVNASLVEPTTRRSMKSQDDPPVMPAGLFSSAAGKPQIRRLPSANGYQIDRSVVPTSASQDR